MEWKLHDEGRSLARNTLDLDRAMMLHHNPAGNREAQPCTPEFPTPRLVGTIETFENPTLIFDSDADARVGDLENRVAASFLHRQMDSSGSPCVLDGIIEQNIQ